MRYQGKIKKWDNAKGFGFISPHGVGEDIFVHISTISNKQRTPKVNDLVTYEIIIDAKRRKKANDVKYVGDISNEESKNKKSYSILGIVIFLILIAVVSKELIQNKGSTFNSTIYKTTTLRNYDPSKYSCQGKINCSEMTSCNEAMFYQEHCSGTQMDGNNDGIPCESQWCN